jgi:hypothetical protein
MPSNAPCQRREDATIERDEVLVEALVRSSGHQASLQSKVARPASPATRKAPCASADLDVPAMLKPELNEDRMIG